jgi:hypothetical protein
MSIYHSSSLIRTRYLSPTSARGSRIKASCKAGSITIPYPHELSGADCHVHAVKALIKKLKLDWGSEFIIGEDDQGLYFVPSLWNFNRVDLEA